MSLIADLAQVDLPQDGLMILQPDGSVPSVTFDVRQLALQSALNELTNRVNALAGAVTRVEVPAGGTYVLNSQAYVDAPAGSYFDLLSGSTLRFEAIPPAGWFAHITIVQPGTAGLPTRITAGPGFNLRGLTNPPYATGEAFFALAHTDGAELFGTSGEAGLATKASVEALRKYVDNLPHLAASDILAYKAGVPQQGTDTAIFVRDTTDGNIYVRLPDGSYTLSSRVGIDRAALDAALDLNDVQIANATSLAATLTAQATADTPLMLHFTASVTHGGATYDSGTIAWVPPNSQAINVLFTLPATLADTEVGAKAFRNPPSDLNDAQKQAARNAIDAVTATGGTADEQARAGVQANEQSIADLQSVTSDLRTVTHTEWENVSDATDGAFRLLSFNSDASISTSQLAVSHLANQLGGGSPFYNVRLRIPVAGGRGPEDFRLIVGTDVVDTQWSEDDPDATYRYFDELGGVQLTDGARVRLQRSTRFHQTEFDGDVPETPTRDGSPISKSYFDDNAGGELTLAQQVGLLDSAASPIILDYTDTTTLTAALTRTFRVRILNGHVVTDDCWYEVSMAGPTSPRTKLPTTSQPDLDLTISADDAGLIVTAGPGDTLSLRVKFFDAAAAGNEVGEMRHTVFLRNTSPSGGNPGLLTGDRPDPTDDNADKLYYDDSTLDILYNWEHQPDKALVTRALVIGDIPNNAGKTWGGVYETLSGAGAPTTGRVVFARVGGGIFGNNVWVVGNGTGWGLLNNASHPAVYGVYRDRASATAAVTATGVVIIVGTQALVVTNITGDAATFRLWKSLFDQLHLRTNQIDGRFTYDQLPAGLSALREDVAHRNVIINTYATPAIGAAVTVGNEATLPADYTDYDTLIIGYTIGNFQLEGITYTGAVGSAQIPVSQLSQLAATSGSSSEANNWGYEMIVRTGSPDVFARATWNATDRELTNRSGLLTWNYVALVRDSGVRVTHNTGGGPGRRYFTSAENGLPSNITFTPGSEASGVYVRFSSNYVLEGTDVTDWVLELRRGTTVLAAAVVHPNLPIVLEAQDSPNTSEAVTYGAFLRRLAGAHATPTLQDSSLSVLDDSAGTQQQGGGGGGGSQHVERTYWIYTDAGLTTPPILSYSFNGVEFVNVTSSAGDVLSEPDATAFPGRALWISRARGDSGGALAATPAIRVSNSVGIGFARTRDNADGTDPLVADYIRGTHHYYALWSGTGFLPRKPIGEEDRFFAVYDARTHWSGSAAYGVVPFHLDEIRALHIELTYLDSDGTTIVRKSNHTVYPWQFTNLASSWGSYVANPGDTLHIYDSRLQQTVDFGVFAAGNTDESELDMAFGFSSNAANSREVTHWIAGGRNGTYNNNLRIVMRVEY